MASNAAFNNAVAVIGTHYSCVGDTTWSNYTVKADVDLQQDGTVKLLGRARTQERAAPIGANIPLRSVVPATHRRIEAERLRRTFPELSTDALLETPALPRVVALFGAAIAEIPAPPNNYDRRPMGMVNEWKDIGRRPPTT